MWHELMLKVVMGLRHQVIGLNLRQILNQGKAMPKLLAPFMRDFFRALSQLQGIARNSGSRYSCDVTAAIRAFNKVWSGQPVWEGEATVLTRGRNLLLGGSGCMPPRKKWNREALKHFFQRSKHQIVYKYKYDFLATTRFFLFIFTIILICVISWK